jgi:hypothetical protein
MNELCIPLPLTEQGQIAEVEVKIGENKKNYHFRLESFLWDLGNKRTGGIESISETAARIDNLKRSIESYDDKWELIQIFTPDPGSKYIQVLFRQKY